MKSTTPIISAGGGDMKLNEKNAVSDPLLYDQSLKHIRKELALAYRILYNLKINTFPYNHLTADCGSGRFLVNRYGLGWNEVTAENLLLVDKHGNLLEGEGPCLTAAFVIHANIHATLGIDAARIVFHTHQTAATSLACIDWGKTDDVLPPLTPLCKKFVGKTTFDPLYTGIAAQDEEGIRISTVLGNKSILFMANHGITLCATTVSEAVYGVWQLEIASNEAIEQMRIVNSQSQKVPNDELQISRKKCKFGPKKLTIEDANSFFAEQSLRSENTPPGEGHRINAWNGLGAFKSVGYNEDDSVLIKAKVDLAATYQILVHTGLVQDIPDTNDDSCTPTGMLTMLIEDNMLLSKSPTSSWQSACINDIKCTSATIMESSDHLKKTHKLILARLHILKIKYSPACTTLLIIKTPPNASELAKRKTQLLPIVQDSMLFDGYTDKLGDNVTYESLLETPNEDIVKEVESTLSQSSSRVIVGTFLILICGNSPGHVFSMLKRYEKAAGILLKVMDTGKKLKMVPQKVIDQPINKFLCGTVDPMPRYAKIQLEIYKRSIISS